MFKFMRTWANGKGGEKEKGKDEVRLMGGQKGKFSETFGTLKPTWQ